MKKLYKPILVSLCALVFVVLMNCASTASNASSGTSGPLFTGSGGEGMRLGILVPQSQGLNESQAYLPSMVQGVLVSNMSKYSAISVLDRVALDRVITETLDPTYADNFDIVRLGHVAQVGYMMTGNIIRTSSGYSMQINVTDTTPNANTIASYSGTCSVAELDNHSAIGRASLELLTQMGVELTGAARTELGRASSREAITAQTALAQGITAQRSGQTVEAISYYFNASALETTATEALSRLSQATTTIATGSLGTQVRNDIQQRNEWIKLIDETKKFFKDNLPYTLAELYYNPRLDLASINYDRETVNLTFPVQVRLNRERAAALEKIVSDISNGLERTGRRQQWGIEAAVDPFAFFYVFDFDLVNENGKVISTATTPNAIILHYNGRPSGKTSLYSYINLEYYVNFIVVRRDYLPSTTFRNYASYMYGRFTRDGGVTNDSGYIRFFFDVVGSLSGADISRLAEINRSELAKITSNYTDYTDIITRNAGWESKPFFTVKASDISDTLSIRLKNINAYQTDFSRGRDGARINFIRSGNNILPVRAENF